MEFSKDDGKKYQCICVSIDTNEIIWADSAKTKPNAEAVEVMAIMRQGVEDRFFAVVPAGNYEVGKEWRGRRA